MAELPSGPSATVKAIYAAYEAQREDGMRYHLGASLIGDKCERSLWYSFRWATKVLFDGRMLRLFATGQLEEARFVADLRAIGCEVFDFDDTQDFYENLYHKTRQIEVRDDFGHFGGSLDAVLRGVPEAPKAWHVGEFKTHSAKSFAKLLKDRVQKSKPRHYAQMQIYMHFTGIERALYVARNKDTDELYTERLHYDAEEALRLVAKAHRVITAQFPPPRIHNDPTWYECRFCDHHAVCHTGKLPPRHCRTCLNSTPVEGGEWTCDFNEGADIPKITQKLGCIAQRFIPDLVAGRQYDVTPSRTGHDIHYKLTDGTEWTDNGTV